MIVRKCLFLLTFLGKQKSKSLDVAYKKTIFYEVF